MMGNALNIGIIGAGTIAGLHIRNLQQMHDVQIVAISARNAERATQLADATGAHVYTDARRMLVEATLDAVFVCVPPDAHGDLIERAAERGLHVYAEKPIALELATAMRRAEALEHAGVITSVGYMWRYAPVAEQAKALLGANQQSMLLGRMLNGPNGNAWSLDRTRSGGLLVEFATHMLDLLRFLGGEITHVSGAGTEVNAGPATRGIDSAALTLRYANGTVGTLETTWAFLGSVWDVHLIGPETRLHLNLVPERLQGMVRGEHIDAASALSPAVQPHGFSGGPSWYLAARAFIDAVQQRDPALVRSNYRDGVRTLALTLAADEATRTGAVIELPHL